MSLLRSPTKPVAAEGCWPWGKKSVAVLTILVAACGLTLLLAAIPLGKSNHEDVSGQQTTAASRFAATSAGATLS